MIYFRHRRRVVHISGWTPESPSTPIDISDWARRLPSPLYIPRCIPSDGEVFQDSLCDREEAPHHELCFGVEIEVIVQPRGYFYSDFTQHYRELADTLIRYHNLAATWYKGRGTGTYKNLAYDTWHITYDDSLILRPGSADGISKRTY